MEQRLIESGGEEEEKEKKVKKMAPRPTWANNSSEMSMWLKGLPCPVPKAHSCGLGHADQNSTSLVQVLHLQRQQSPGCYGNYHNKEGFFFYIFYKMMHANRWK